MIQIFYHEKDLDGWASGAIAKEVFEDVDKIELIPYDYHKEDKLDSLINIEADAIYFVDCSASPEKLKEYDDKYNNIFVIDHHKSFIEKAQGYKIKGLQDTSMSGCELCFRYFISRKSIIPEPIKLLGRYDVWDNSNKEEWKNRILPYQMGMRLRAIDPKNDTEEGFWYKALAYDGETVRNIIEEGKLINKYQEIDDAKQVKNNSFESIFDGKKVICMNSTRSNSNLFNSIWDENKYDMMLCWYDVKGEKVVVSLYTTRDDLDVSLIAKKYGGGGHKQAAGFTCINIEPTPEEIRVNK